MTYKETIDRDYLERLKKLELPTEKSNNPWVVLHMHGDGERASPKFNFQVYTNRQGQLKLITNDHETLQGLLEGKGRVSEEGKRVILIDDSGWGFPIGGVLCGVYNSETGRFYKREVEVEYFQGENFEYHLYLGRYMVKTLEIVDEINPDPEETIIRICTGYINEKAKSALRKRKLYVVEVDEIGEPLQTWLETQHRKYVSDLVGSDVYYDPKVMSKGEISREFNEVVNFAQRYGLMHLVKTGWKYFQG